MQDLQALVDKTVTQLGFELVDFEVSNRGKLLRVFIDKVNPKDNKDSVTIDDCVLVSNQLGNVLTVDHDIDYDRLEISSAGLDRVLNKLAHFARFAGEHAQVRLRVPVPQASGEPRKKFLGILRGVDADKVLLEVDGKIEKIALVDIEKARLSPQF